MSKIVIPKNLGELAKLQHIGTNDENIAKKIAKDHLKEDPLYYTKLVKAGLS